VPRGERAPPGTVARRGITAESIRRLLPRAENQPVEDVDTEVLRAIGIDFEGVRAVVEETFGSGSLKSAPDRRAAATKTRRPPFTPEAKQALELSLRVALELHDRRIRPVIFSRSVQA